ncbi:hypothetical protein LTR62_003474 [Meristemomyces frigidus]|uniref:Heterokaryon incompatibility domain-containing protein n=1 Tax=Meristemomyces frigidus TaxID=1508187 RepID=A0AAN7TRV1_9PEZI|nr:hypothetical protein LTR62_003474 [Meristemomyces frigidus]
MEKSWQVPLMTDIYSNATTVHAWLGPKPTDQLHTVSNICNAFGYMDRIWEVAQQTKEYDRLKSEDDLLQACFVISQSPAESSQQQNSRAQKAWADFAQELRIAVRDKDLLDAALPSLAAFSQLDWFQRIWILQESGRARALTFHYSEQQISHRHVLLSLSLARAGSAALKKQALQRESTFDDRFVSCMTARVTCSKGISLLEVLKLSYFERSVTHNASDPRDRIYALMGLARSQHEIPVDYDLSTDEVYIWTARFLLKHGFTDLLIQVKPYGSRGLVAAGFPSWAHDWSLKSVPLFARFKAAGETKQELSFVRCVDAPFKTALVIKGIALGLVMGAGSTFASSASAAKFTPAAIRGGRLRDTELETLSVEDEQMLREQIVQLHRSLGSQMESTQLDTLFEASLAKFWHWWLQWLKSVHDLLSTTQSGNPPLQLQPTIADMLLREAPPKIRETDAIKTLIARSLLNPTYLLQTLLPLRATGSPEIGVELASSLFRSAWNTRLIILLNGVICSGPESTQINDQVILCRGVSAPLVVRRVGEELWRIIGPAFVCGAMGGEKIRGEKEERMFTVI